MHSLTGNIKLNEDFSVHRFPPFGLSKFLKGKGEMDKDRDDLMRQAIETHDASIFSLISRALSINRD